MKLRIAGTLLAVVLLAGYMLAESSIMTPFTGTDTFVGALSSGTIICPGGQPNPTWSTGPCTQGSRVHIRDSKFLYRFNSPGEDRMTGSVELVANGNFDGWRTDLPPGFPGGAGSGQMWGTLRVTLDRNQNEVWEGTWTGTRTVTGQQVVITTHNVLFGAGANIQGLKAEFTGTGDPVTGGSFQGWILAPPGK